MNYFWDINVPSETDKDNPYIEKLKVDYGKIKHVILVILSGHAGLTGIQIFYHEVQVYPHNSESWFHGDGLKIEFNDNYPITTPPYELIAKAYNDDIRYNHSFLLSINILQDELDEPMLGTDFNRYIGVTG